MLSALVQDTAWAASGSCQTQVGWGSLAPSTMPLWPQERTRNNENTLAVKSEAGAPGRPRSALHSPSLPRGLSLAPWRPWRLSVTQCG